MAIRAYYDGSADERREHWITLAGFSAADCKWKKFKLDWHDTLVAHRAPVSPISGEPYVHMKEAMSGSKGYLGWSLNRVKPMIKDLNRVLFKFNEQVSGAVCTVNLDDYQLAKKHIAGHPDSPECICVDTCVSAIAIPRYCKDRSLHLYFDKNEPFLHKINRVWLENKKRKEAGWPRQIQGIVKINSQSEIGVQAADVIAWIFNRHYTIGDHEDMYSWASFQPSKLFNYDRIMARYCKSASRRI
jgi:hypothetical protein